MSMRFKKPLLEKGTVLNDKWEILAHIATGGKGEVYRARQTNLNREVAIKIVSPEFIESLEEDEEDLADELARFKREVLAMAQTRHPNILQVYDYDKVEIQGKAFEYIAMEYIPGSTLRLTIPQEGFGANAERLRQWIENYFFPILDGVDAIHHLGIVHRDLKPENVLLDEDIPKITDFGLAGGRQWEPITRSHHALGTILYMAPEQFSDMDLTDARADVYALGKMLYEAVLGKMEKVASYPLQTASLPNPDTEYLKQLDRIIRQATAKDPSQRIPSVKELKRVLERVIMEPVNNILRPADEKDTITQGKIRRILPAVLVVALSILLLVGVWYHFQGISDSKESRVPTGIPSIDKSGAKSVKSQDLAQISKTPGSKYIGLDGATLRFVPGDEFLLKDDAGDDSGQPVTVMPFFMDENEVTNHQYVEFLNTQTSRIEIDKDMVKVEDAIWLFLGEIKEGYEPIVFRDGLFKVNGPEHAACPVVRVTAFGAEAYARHNGRRLPTVNEWLHAAKARHVETDVSATITTDTAEQPKDNRSMADSHTMMHGAQALPEGFDTSPSPIGQTPANEFSIIGLDANVSEWATNQISGNNGRRYFVMGGLGETKAEPSSRAIGRYPWEAFGTVGFRTVISTGR